MKQDRDMTVLIDIDGVVADSHVGWLKMYNDDYDDHLTVDQIIGWDIHKYVKPECGRKIYEYLSNQDFYYYVPEVDGAYDAIRKIRKFARVIFVSSGFFVHKIKWMHDHRFLKEYPYNDGRWETVSDVVLCHDKNLIKGYVLVDDKIENAVEFERQSILFTRPWNKDFTDLGTHIYRADDWDAVVYLLKVIRGV